ALEPVHSQGNRDKEISGPNPNLENIREELPQLANLVDGAGNKLAQFPLRHQRFAEGHELCSHDAENLPRTSTERRRRQTSRINQEAFAVAAGEQSDVR